MQPRYLTEIHLTEGLPYLKHIRVGGVQTCNPQSHF